MSVVSGVVLLTTSSAEEYSTIALLDRWLTEKGFAKLADITDHASGSKHPQINILAAGYNYFPEEDFIQFVINLDWNCPENVILMINPEDGRSRVITLCER